MSDPRGTWRGVDRRGEYGYVGTYADWRHSEDMAVSEARAILAQSEPAGDEAFFSDPYSAPCAPGRNGGDFYSGFYNDGCQGEAHVNLMHAIRRALDSGAFDEAGQ